ncbi:CHAP domain-containing protein [Nakamurella silvestris]|nr:CHAP domain-containing protein [Nakamurella silvestris]
MATKTAVLDVARSQVGYNGTGTENNPLSKYGDWYGINPGQWCAMFLSWCDDQAGGGSFPKFAYCPNIESWGQNNGRWIDKDGDPQVGDIVVMDYGLGRASHVGFLEAVYDTYIVTLEGNTTDAGQGRTGNSMRRKQHNRNGREIRGYVRPNYSATPPPPAPTPKPGIGMSKTRRAYQLPKGQGYAKAGVKVKGYSRLVDGTGSEGQKANVIRLQKALARKGYPLTGTGFYGPATAAAVLDFQRKTKGKVSPSGAVGPKTWELIGVTD